MIYQGFSNLNSFFTKRNIYFFFLSPEDYVYTSVYRGNCIVAHLNGKYLDLITIAESWLSTTSPDLV